MIRVPACPTCSATTGHACRRPSGHRGGMHAARRALAARVLEKLGEPEGEYELREGALVLVLAYPTPDEWEAMTPDERAAWPERPAGVRVDLQTSLF